MTYREKYRASSKWQNRVKIMYLYHVTLVSTQKRWSVEKTADYFRVSKGLVSENLNLAANLPLISKERSRDQALVVLRGSKDGPLYRKV